MYHANIPDRKPYNFLCDQKIQEYTKKAVSFDVSFHVAGMTFRVSCIKKHQIGNNGCFGDNDNIKAFLNGYTHLISFAAINTVNGKIYAIYEVYSHNDRGPYLNKSIDVDCNHQRIGIGTAFMKKMAIIGIDARRSNQFTRAGARFFNSLDIKKNIETNE